MKKLWIAVFILFLVSCTSIQKHPAGLPQSRTIAVTPNSSYTIFFPRTWDLYTKIGNMPPAIQGIARNFKRQNVRIALFGFGFKQTIAARALHESIERFPAGSIKAETFLQFLRMKYQKELLNYRIISKTPETIIWTYTTTTKGNSIKFFEKIMIIDKHVVRISLWTLESYYATFESEFNLIIKYLRINK